MDASRSRRFLVAVDDSEASARAVLYLGGLLAGGPLATRGAFEVKLLHLLPPLPLALMEHGGAATRAEEGRIEAEQEAAQAGWIREATAAAGPMLERARATLTGCGVAEEAIEIRCAETICEDRAADMIIREAGVCDCGTVVVGRGSLPWLRDIFHRHIGEELVKHAEGLSVLVVE